MIAHHPASVQPVDLDLAQVRARMERYAPQVAELVRRYPVRRAILLQVLHLVQQEFGWVPRVAIRWAAEVSGVSPVHAFSVVEFYTMYRQVPMGRHLIQVCHTMCCHIQGSEQLIAHLERRLGIRCGETTADGLFSLVRVECLALCGTGPGVMIDDQAIGPTPHPLGGELREEHLAVPNFHPTPAVLDAWIDFLREQAARAPHPGRHHEHDALGGLIIGSAGHPGAEGASAQPLPADYAPACPAFKVAARRDGEQAVITWVNDPLLTVRCTVERSQDRGASWQPVAEVGGKEQRACVAQPAGVAAAYRIIAHEKTRSARPSAVVEVPG
ncbi:MAG: NAD(P)H-dependent oxidoreductase subunit E [Planctomycetes bacterium]|nr:NAD(P)H-dependent oxidoreductase subunit E [Planctomycetota bacterium]